MYEVVKPIILPSEDGSSSKHYAPGAVVDLSEEQAGELLPLGRIKLVGGEPASALDLDDPRHDDNVVELVEPEDDEKPLKAHTVDELRELAKSLGASADSVDHLKKAELLEAVERLTHTSD